MEPEKKDEKSDKPKTKFALVLDWANKDKICSLALFGTVLSLAPHVGDLVWRLAVLFVTGTAIAGGK